METENKPETPKSGVKPLPPANEESLITQDGKWRYDIQLPSNATM